MLTLSGNPVLIRQTSSPVQTVPVLDEAINSATHFLVDQAPLEECVPYFQSRAGGGSPSRDAARLEESLTEMQGYLPEDEFRGMYGRGEITDENLGEARRRLGWPAGHGVLLPGLTQASLEHALLTRHEHRIEPALRDWVLGLPWVETIESPADEWLCPGELCRRVAGLALTSATRSILVPHCARFLGYGMVGHQEPVRERFWPFFLGCVSGGGVLASSGMAMEADARRRIADRQSPGQAVLELLGLPAACITVILGEAVRSSLQRHPGWAALFHRLEQNPEERPQPDTQVHLVDFLGVLLFIEFHIARETTLKMGIVSPREAASARSLSVALRQILKPIEKTPELRREPWDLCLALLDLGFSARVLSTMDSTSARKSLMDATLGFGQWRRLTLWQEAYEASLPGNRSAGVPAERLPVSRPAEGIGKHPPLDLMPKQIYLNDHAPIRADVMKVLLIEDDLLIGKAVVRGLEDIGHECIWMKNGRAGLEEGLAQRHDVVLLDLMLPEIAGLDVLRQMRAQGVRTPVVVVTALGAVDERVAGLRDGADDYLVTPFAFPELLARLEAVRRRSSNRPAPSLQVGQVHLDLTNRRVTCGGNQIELTPTGFSLLEILMRNAGHVVTRKMLCEHLWEGEWEGVTNVIEVHVNRLRNKLALGGAEGLIQTVRGRGYTLKAL